MPRGTGEGHDLHTSSVFLGGGDPGKMELPAGVKVEHLDPKMDIIQEGSLKPGDYRGAKVTLPSGESQTFELTGDERVDSITRTNASNFIRPGSAGTRIAEVAPVNAPMAPSNFAQGPNEKKPLMAKIPTPGQQTSEEDLEESRY